MTKCMGCGIELSSKDIDSMGYTNDISNGLCMRCFRLKHYGEYKSVSLDNNDYMKIIEGIDKDSLVIYVTDILSLSINNIDRFNNVIIVVTKWDIMPKNVSEYKIIEYIKKRYNNVIDVILVSSKKNYNIDCLYNSIVKYGSDYVYFIGNTNMGKSSLINRIISNYGYKDNDVTVSMYPSTTLDTVNVKIGDINIVDTPGLIDKGSIINYVNGKDLKMLMPKSEIRPRSCQINGKGSIVIDKFVRLDYDTNDKNSIIIYGSRNLNIRFNNINNDNMLGYDPIYIDVKGGQDVVISGICFIKVVKDMKFIIYTKAGVIPIVRDSLI